jgi:hypothetical protein
MRAQQRQHCAGKLLAGIKYTITDILHPFQIQSTPVKLNLDWILAQACCGKAPSSTVFCNPRPCDVDIQDYYVLLGPSPTTSQPEPQNRRRQVRNSMQRA